MIAITKARLNWFLLFAVIAGHSDALAQDVPPTAQLRPVLFTARAGGPIPVVWALNWNGAGLLEGDMQLELLDGNDPVGRVRIEGIVLTGGEQSFRAMLPPLASSNAFGELTIRAVFTTESRTIDLGRHLLRVPGEWQRIFGLCVCARWDLGESPALRDLARRLGLEEFHPGRRRQDDPLARRELNTSQAQLHPDDMPGDALTYCAFNLVMIDPRALAELRKHQLQALGDWVKAGGSLCVFADGALDAAHVAFLNELAAGDPDAAALALDPQGRVVPTAAFGPDRIRLIRRGLGRVAACAGSPESIQNLDERRWREVAAFLWHVRKDQWSEVVARGRWDGSRVRSALGDQTGSGPNDPRQSYFDLAPVPLPTAHQLLTRLMPRDVRVVPLGLIGLILLVYVLLIGPADYLVLGYFRQRKLTWIVFPAVTVGVTLLTVWLSRAYLSSNEARRAVVFRDIGDGGEVVRENLFEVVFTGTPKEVRTDVRRALFTSLDGRKLGGGIDPDYGPYRQEAALVGPAKLAGRFPAQYTVLQDVPQWTPQPNRTLAIAPDASPPEFDWSAVSPLKLRSSATRRGALERLRRAFGSSATVYLFHQNSAERLMGMSQLFSVDDNRYGPQRPPNSRRRPAGFLYDVCVQPDVGLFGVVSRVAPAGGTLFEDLSLLDPSDPDEWLLVVAVEEGDGLVVYRKLYVRQ